MRLAVSINLDLASPMLGLYSFPRFSERLQAGFTMQELIIHYLLITVTDSPANRKEVSEFP